MTDVKFWECAKHSTIGSGDFCCSSCAWEGRVEKLTKERDTALLQLRDEMEVAKARKTMADNWAKRAEDANRLLRELQERYDIYAKHLKTCVVYVAPEIPCDCGFLSTPTEKPKHETEEMRTMREAAEQANARVEANKRKCVHPSEYADSGKVFCTECKERLI